MGRKTESINVKGFVRTQIVDELTGKIVGDSGFVENQVVNQGFQDYIVGAIGGVAGSKQVTHMAIGTGTAPGATATSLEGETGTRVTTSNSAVASKTLQCTCQFAGSDMGSTCTIQNVALINSSATGTILCGTTYTTSQWASNQNVRNWRQAMVTLFSKHSQIRWTPRTGNTELSLEKGKCRDLTGELFTIVKMKIKSELYRDIQNATEMIASLYKSIMVTACNATYQLRFS